MAKKAEKKRKGALIHRRVGVDHRRSRIGNGFVFFLILMLGLFMAFPLYYTFIQSIKPTEELFQFPSKLYVVHPTWDSYTEVFRLMNNLWVPFSRYLFNSLFVAVAGTFFHVWFAGMAAYAFAKLEFKGRDLIFALIMLGLLFVGQVTALPTFVIIAKLQLLNTYGAYIFPFIGTSLGLFLMKQFIEQIPDALIEAARIDGTSEWGIFYKIIVPNVKPAICTVCIFQFINIWNGMSKEYVYEEQIKGVKVALEQISSSSTYARMGAGMAGSVLLMIPPIVVFIVLQSSVVETMTCAGIKE